MKLTRLSSDRLFYGLIAMLCRCCVVFAAAIFVFLVGSCLSLGWSRLSTTFIVTATAQAGLAGGIVYQILGSLILISGAALLVAPVAMAFAMIDWLLRQSKPGFRRILQGFLHLVNATPSILFGLIGFIFFHQKLAWGKSWLSGCIILALMILPTVSLAIVQRMATIPPTYIETARSLGYRTDEILTRVLIPHSLGGLLMGLFMGLSRALGETAPIMFIASVFSGATLPNGIGEQPVLSLPYHIFNLSQEMIDERALSNAWAAAFVLLVIVLMMSLILAPFRARSHEEANR